MHLVYILGVVGEGGWSRGGGWPGSSTISSHHQATTMGGLWGGYTNILLTQPKMLPSKLKPNFVLRS